MSDDKSSTPKESSEDESLRQRIRSSSEPGIPIKPTTAPDLPKGADKTADQSTADRATEEEPNKQSGPSQDVQSERQSEPLADSPLDDKTTDEAIDDIAAKESDTVLALEDARNAKSIQPTAKASGWKAKLRNICKNKWTWVGLAGLLTLILALPVTRYDLLGIFIKEPVKVTVLDSITSTPVSNAEVTIAGANAKTNGDGRAQLKVSLGKHILQINKQYYKSLSQSYFVGFKSMAQSKIITLTATGRLVPITVINRISGQPVANAQIKLKGTTAKTNAKGRASIALPTTANSYTGTVTLDGYNSASITVLVTDQVVKANNFQLTPSGQIFFLSNLSGAIDVVKTNLDGSGRKTVLAGTSHEDSSNTVLLASRDWHYLVLKANRDGSSQPALYLIDANGDKVTEFDKGSSNITLVGWYDHNFIYDEVRSGQSYWQTGREALKSYNADNLQLNQLDQDQAEGSASSYAYQGFANFYITNGYVVYSTFWNTFTSDGSVYNTSNKSDSIRAAQANGQGEKDYQTFPAANTSYIQAQAYSPQAIYFSVYNSNTGASTYYSYSNQSVQSANINNGAFVASYPTYIVSPSSKQTFWTELLDGQNAFFVGDSSANFKKQIASLSSYSPYGWFSNDYVLVSKNSSQLYVMPASGLSSGQQPLKVTDYFKSAQNFSGYGYGYGGL